jgi:hypothetical protein
VRTISSGWPARRPGRGDATVRYAIGGDNVVGVKEAGGAIVPLNVQYSPEYIDTVDKLRRRRW